MSDLPERHEPERHLDEPEPVTSSAGNVEPDEDELFGRVGYGRYARYSPALLALLIVAVVAVIGWREWQPEDDLPSPGSLINEPAPEFTLTLFSGEELSLADLRGQAVALNFWGSWCAPCKEEMPDLEEVNQELLAAGEPVTVVGVGIKRDYEQNARDLAAELEVTYPIGRDTAGDDPVRGPIEAAYGITAYPATVFIRPDGTISAIRLGQVEAGEIRAYFEDALGDRGALARR